MTSLGSRFCSRISLCLCVSVVNAQSPQQSDIIPAMAAETKTPGMVPDELKFEPKSKGLGTPRKKNQRS